MSQKNKQIEIKGARVHNLKNIDLTIPHNQLIVITGLSGSGKSSLAFDTLFAEGQRRYVESLSSYARQFLGRLDKPDVDYIKGIAPAIAIEQKVISTNPRSTVGTVTEIYDYLKVLFARIGKTYSPKTGKEIKKHSVTDVVNFIQQFKVDTKYYILAPWKVSKDRSVEKSIEILISQGYSRVFIDENVFNLSDLKKTDYINDKSFIIIDRLKHEENDENYLSRIGDSIQTAFYEGFGDCFIYLNDDEVFTHFSSKFEEDGVEFIEPTVNFFTFNNPYGACKTCEGFGSMIGIDEELVIPDTSLSIYQDAVVAWKGETMREWKNQLIYGAEKNKFPIHKSIEDFSESEMDILWNGCKEFKGIHQFFAYLQSKTYKIHYRIMLSRYRGKTKCTDCRGTRVRKDTNFVKIDGKNISDLLLTPINELKDFFETIQLLENDGKIGERLILEIKNRLTYLVNVGLGYLDLNRPSATLSGGESQRINLANSLGSALVGSIYILDEPSIGLHPKDTSNLISILQNLKRIGNTVLVVEHEEDMMKAADQIIDLGPFAGINGGEIVFQGSHDKLINAKGSLTADYLTGRRKIPMPEKRRKLNQFIEIHGAKENNLKNIDVKIPLFGLVCITGVSGSGKSTLVKQILAPVLQKKLGKSFSKIGQFKSVSGDLRLIKDIELIDQNPIGRSSRSNPATYLKAFDFIREIYSNQKLSKVRGYKPGFFSYNVPGGRCETCKGDGEITISMQFMADVNLVCEDCKGKRYTSEALEVEFKEKNITDILNMTIEDALAFFDEKSPIEKKVKDRIQPLFDLGLGYLKMGQSSSTMSGGEAQRVKLASFLVNGQKNISSTLFIFDEPTTGLHFYDIEKLLKAFNELIALGHSIVVIEHNMDVVKCADWIIDIGPEGGKNGGNIIFEGTPEEMVKDKKSITGEYLVEKLNG